MSLRDPVKTIRGILHQDAGMIGDALLDLINNTLFPVFQALPRHGDATT